MSALQHYGNIYIHVLMGVKSVILMIVKFELAQEGKEVMMKAWDGKKLVESMVFQSHFS